jgi:transposase
MNKDSNRRQRSKGDRKNPEGPITIGMDLGDRNSRCCVLDQAGDIVEERSIPTTRKGLLAYFGPKRRCRVAIEVGTHSPWVSRLLKELGFEAVVANARQVQLISASSRKDDRMDAEMLARLVRVDPKLLRPIQHRSEQAQSDLIRIRVRAALVESRSQLVNAARGLAKAMGERLPACDADCLGVASLEGLGADLAEALKPLLVQVRSLTAQIKACDAVIEQIARTKYPETKLLQQVKGVGTLIALTFVLTIDDRDRFGRSRDVGCYFGLRPKRGDSGEKQPQLRITREGDVYLRKLLVQGAHYILAKGPDTDLKRWGGKLAERGGKNARKRAVVAVARKLGVLLHRLWVTGEEYEPLRNSRNHPRTAAAA